ncbi:MAG: helix-turn-helix transcriptional regulator [Acidovorax sp.]
MKSLYEFSEALSQAKRTQKRTAKELAQSTGLSSLAVRQILAGTSAPKLTNAMALATALGLELVLVPTAMAESLQQPSRGASRTVLTDVERLLGMRLEGPGPCTDG